MKIKNILINAILLLSIGNLVSCQKQDHAYEHFVKDGERIYIGKVIDVVGMPGEGRVGLSWGVFDSRAKKVKVKYNDGLDSVILEVNKTSSVDYMQTIIENLEERIYSFQIFTLDVDGNQSVGYSVDCQSYGENYRLTLNNRFINTVTKSGNNVTINWVSAKEPVVETEIEYTELGTNLLKIMELPVSSNSIVLTNVDITKAIRYRTMYKPTSEAIDYFYSNYSTYSIN